MTAPVVIDVVASAVAVSVTFCFLYHNHQSQNRDEPLAEHLWGDRKSVSRFK